jgi:hypothetical protein
VCRAKEKNESELNKGCCWRLMGVQHLMALCAAECDSCYLYTDERLRVLKNVFPYFNTFKITAELPSGRKELICSDFWMLGCWGKEGEKLFNSTPKRELRGNFCDALCVQTKEQKIKGRSSKMFSWNQLLFHKVKICNALDTSSLINWIIISAQNLVCDVRKFIYCWSN